MSRALHWAERIMRVHCSSPGIHREHRRIWEWLAVTAGAPLQDPEMPTQTQRISLGVEAIPRAAWYPPGVARNRKLEVIEACLAMLLTIAPRVWSSPQAGKNQRSLTKIVGRRLPAENHEVTHSLHSRPRASQRDQSIENELGPFESLRQDSALAISGNGQSTAGAPPRSELAKTRG